MEKPTLQAMRRVIFSRLRDLLGKIDWIDRRVQTDRVKGNAIVLHGMREHMDSPSFAALVVALHSAGYNVLACNFPHHGAHTEGDAKRGSVQSFWEWIDVARVLCYRVLLSRTRGKHPTFVISYSAGALSTARLLQLKPLLRKGIAGAVFLSIPLKVDHNASVELRRWMPYIRPVRGFLKRIAPNYPVSCAKEESLDDPHYFTGPYTLLTSVEIYNATIAATATGFIERLRDVEHIAFMHGIQDEIAPVHAAYDAWKRIVGEDLDACIKVKRQGGFRQVTTLDRKRAFYQYAGVGHNILAESPQCILDVVTTLNGWLKTAKPEPVFTDDGFLTPEDLLKFGWYAISRAFGMIWDMKHMLLKMLRFRNHR